MQCKNVEDVSLLRFAGSSFYGEPSNKNLLAVAEINDAFVKSFYLEQYLLEGRYPLNENEIVLTQDFIDDNGLTFSVILRAEGATGNMLHAGFRQRPCDRAIIQASDALSSLILKGLDKKIKQTQYF